MMFLFHTDQKRVPLYADRLWYLNVVLIFSATASAVVSFAGYGAWVAAMSMVSTALLASTEFAGFQNKLARYTGVLQQTPHHCLVQLWQRAAHHPAGIGR